MLRIFVKKLNLKIVPIVLKGTIDDGVSFIQSKPKSIISNDKECGMEGIVGMPNVPVYDKMGKRVIVKIKVRDFDN